MDTPRSRYSGNLSIENMDFAGLVLSIGIGAQVIAEFATSCVLVKVRFWKCILPGFLLMNFGIALVNIGADNPLFPDPESS